MDPTARETWPRYPYRGTTRRWPGNESCQAEARTCASTDPLVATLYAIYCRNFGPAVVHVLETAGHTFLESGNCLADVEAEVIVRMMPLEFEAAAALTMDVERAVGALEALGVPVPPRLPVMGGRLTRFLQNEKRRLRPEEIARFNVLCGVGDND